METPHLDKEIEFIENTHWKFAKNEVWQSKLVEYKAIKQALRIHDVVGQSEQFSCPLPEARCDRHKINDEEGRWEFCNTCEREWAR